MITQEELKRIVNYNPETGVFIWAVRRSQKVKAGHIAGGFNNNGYWRMNINRRSYPAHRLAWLYMYGSFPPEGVDIDHKDLDKGNNRIANLRLATPSQNQSNTKIVARTTTGFKGVDYHKYSNGYRARIMVEGKRRHLGVFGTAEEAGAAYKKASLMYFGEFSIYASSATDA